MDVGVCRKEGMGSLTRNPACRISFRSGFFLQICFQFNQSQSFLFVLCFCVSFFAAVTAGEGVCSHDMQPFKPFKPATCSPFKPVTFSHDMQPFKPFKPVTFSPFKPVTFAPCSRSSQSPVHMTCSNSSQSPFHHAAVQTSRLFT